MYSEFKIKLPIYAYCSTHIDTFKLDVYVSQLYFNVTSKVARYTVQHKSSTMKSQTSLMNNQRFIKIFPTEFCHLYLSPMKCIISLQLSRSFHTGLISRSFSQPKFCTIRQSNLLCTSCSIRIVTYITYLNVYIIIEPYTLIRCVAMTV